MPELDLRRLNTIDYGRMYPERITLNNEVDRPFLVPNIAIQFRPRYDEIPETLPAVSGWNRGQEEWNIVRETAKSLGFGYEPSIFCLMFTMTVGDMNVHHTLTIASINASNNPLQLFIEVINGCTRKINREIKRRLELVGRRNESEDNDNSR